MKIQWWGVPLFTDKWTPRRVELSVVFFHFREVCIKIKHIP